METDEVCKKAIGQEQLVQVVNLHSDGNASESSPEILSYYKTLGTKGRKIRIWRLLGLS